MPDWRQSRSLGLPDLTYTPLDQIGGPGIGGAGNEEGMPMGLQQGNIEGVLDNIAQLSQERSVLENGLEKIRGMPSHRMMTGEEMWQGVKDAGSQGLDFLRRGVDAITPSQDTTDEFNRRLQRANSIVNGGTPMYMQEQQFQQQMGQQDQLMQMKRMQTAQHLQELQQKKQEHDETQALAIWKDHQMPLAMKKKLSQQLSLKGNVLAGNLEKLGDEQVAAELDTLLPFIPKDKAMKIGQIMSSPNPDIDFVEQWIGHAREKKKIVGEQRMKSERFSELLQQHSTEGLDPMSPEFDEFKQMVQDREKRHNEAAELNMKLEQMGLTKKKAEQELLQMSTMPKEVASGAIGQNQQFTDIYDPATQKTTRTVGKKAPLVEVNTGTKATEEAQKKFMDKAAENYDRLRNVPDALRNIEEAKALIPGAKHFMGPAGETLLEATKFLNNRFGTNIATTGVKNAEELRSRIFFNIMDNLKKLDAQPSQQQQQVMQDSLGKLGTDPQAMGSILDAYGDSLRGKVDLHNKEVESAEKRGVRFPFEPRINLNPKANKPKTQRSLDDLLKQYGGK